MPAVPASRIPARCWSRRPTAGRGRVVPLVGPSALLLALMASGNEWPELRLSRLPARARGSARRGAKGAGRRGGSAAAPRSSLSRRPIATRRWLPPCWRSAGRDAILCRRRSDFAVRTDLQAHGGRMASGADVASFGQAGDVFARARLTPRQLRTANLRPNEKRADELLLVGVRPVLDIALQHAILEALLFVDRLGDVVKRHDTQQSRAVDDRDVPA